MYFNSVLWIFLIATAVIGMIDDIEHPSNHHRLMFKIPLIIAVAMLRKDSPTFLWEFWAFVTLFPIIEFFWRYRKGEVMGPPIFDHMLPSIVSFVMLILRYFR